MNLNGCWVLNEVVFALHNLSVNSNVLLREECSRLASLHSSCGHQMLEDSLFVHRRREGFVFIRKKA